MFYTVLSETLDSTLGIALVCKLFNSLHTDLARLLVDQLEHVHAVFEYWTPSSRVYLRSFLGHFQYLLTSLVVNLEYKYPFVFSFYGKQLVQLNYKNLIRTLTELATPLDNASQPDHSEILNRAFCKLHVHILTEYNTLNVMKECDTLAYRLKQCRNYKTSSRDKRSIKNKAYCLRVLADSNVNPDPAVL